MTIIKKTLIVLLLATCTLLGQGENTGNNVPGNIYSSVNLISVTIGGSFVVNGTFQSSNNERLDQFITRIFGIYGSRPILIEETSQSLDDRATVNSRNSEAKEYAMRNITLKRRNGETLRIDLARFRLTGDFQFNPYLKNDDVIIFPPFDNSRDFIAVEGAVNKPVKFQFVEGDKLSDAILFAQGISSSYEKVETAEIIRLDYSGSREEVIKVDINNGGFPLKVGDRIRLLASETQRKDFRVLVLGEVNQPGYIYIPKNGISLKDAVIRAGGLKPTADLAYSELLRGTDSYSLYKKHQLANHFSQDKSLNQFTQYNPESDYLLEKAMMYRMAHFIEEDSIYFNVDERIRAFRPSGLVDFTKLNEPDSEAASFPVKEGDIILIPQISNLVYVFGQVANPGFIRLSEGKDIFHYIEKSGGLGVDAKEREYIMLIRGKTREWIANKEGSRLIPQSGDFIWIPKKTPRTFDYYLGRVGAYAGLVGSVATIILLLVQFGK